MAVQYDAGACGLSILATSENSRRPEARIFGHARDVLRAAIAATRARKGAVTVEIFTPTSNTRRRASHSSKRLLSEPFVADRCLAKLIPHRPQICKPGLGLGVFQPLSKCGDDLVAHSCRTAAGRAFFANGAVIAVSVGLAETTTSDQSADKMTTSHEARP